jgi:hypothetical protein
MRTIEQTLALWVSSLMTSDEVIQWASKEIARIDQPPMELFDLVSDGPERCLKRSISDFSPRPTHLTFVEEFSIRACALSFDSDESVLKFADWASRRCMGEDLSDSMVKFGYHMDHLLDDCQDKSAARAVVREELPLLMPQCNLVAAPFQQTEVSINGVQRT